MKHDWVAYSEGPEDISYHGRRRCLACGKIQSKEAQDSWTRVVGYRWTPAAGRCKPIPLTEDEVGVGDVVEYEGVAYEAVVRDTPGWRFRRTRKDGRGDRRFLLDFLPLESCRRTGGGESGAFSHRI